MKKKKHKNNLWQKSQNNQNRTFSNKKVITKETTGAEENNLTNGKETYYLMAPGTGFKFTGGVIYFLLGVGLTAFILINPFNFALFTRVALLLPQGSVGSTPVMAETQTQLWTCPMHPEVIQNEPGNCPKCGMKLVPLSVSPPEQHKISSMKEHSEDKQSAHSHPKVITIDPITIQNIGVRSEKVRRGKLSRVIRTVGVLDYNEKNIVWVNTKYSGWIEKVYKNYVGEEVKKGEKLFEIYSPELVATQEEYLSALQYRDSLKQSSNREILRQADQLLEAARKRLRYWDITDEQIKNLETTRIPQRTLAVVSPVDGVIVKKFDQALQGIFVKPGMNLYQIADISSIWIYADIYESDAPWINPGDEAVIELSHFPDVKFYGKILFLKPYLSEKTRTIKACIEVPNSTGQLKPGMYANIKLKPTSESDVIYVTDNAVLHSGERNLVFIDLGNGKFKPQDVELGIQGDGVVEVRTSLTGNEYVVTSAQFLLDSESRLQEAIQKMLGHSLSAPSAETHSDYAKDNLQSSTLVTTPSARIAHSIPTKKETDSKKLSLPIKAEKAFLASVSTYLEMGKLLVNDATFGVEQKASKIAHTLAEAISANQDKETKALLSEIVTHAKRIKGNDIQSLRLKFKDLSNAYINALRKLEFHPQAKAQTYYVMYCDMFPGSWLQATPVLENPYYGAQMLRCGRIQQKIHINPKGGSAIKKPTPKESKPSNTLN